MRISERLNAIRHRHFIGRNAELEQFEQVIQSSELPYNVIHVFGPGGIGKTSLIKQFVTTCLKHGIHVIHLDARNVDPVPDGVRNAIRDALGLSQEEDVAETLTASRYVLIIDTYELLAQLDSWLRDEFLPNLSENILLITAGRNAPSPEWQIDQGWQSLVKVIPLRNLSPDEGRQFLASRNVPSELHDEFLRFTHGHPLALSLVSDVMAQRSSIRLEPEAVPDIVRTLLAQFVEKVPGPAHRAALESCALVRVMTEALLSEMLARDEVHDMFEWLRGLSFVESGGDGLFPHDLAREALLADVKWRNPDWYVELHKRARNYYAERIKTAGAQDQQKILYDYVYLHRDNSIIREIFQWQGGSSVLAEPANAADIPILTEIVRQHEGNESAKFAEYWFRHQPEGTLVVREAGGKPVGLLQMLRLQKLSPEQRNEDPAVRSAWNCLLRKAPLRPGEGATLFRFWMADETYQSVSQSQSIIFVNVGRHYLTEPALAYTFFPCHDPDFWAAGFAYIDLHRLPDADFEIGGQRYGVYGHDWRVVPAWQWLALLAERELGVEPAAPVQSVSETLVLSEEEFTESVRTALRSYNDPSALQHNPLIRSRMILSHSQNDSIEGRVGILRNLIAQAIDALKHQPKGDKYTRVLERTYLRPVASQERAAELLNLPFSTYRRHLTSGTERVVQQLWQQELGWKNELSSIE